MVFDHKSKLFKLESIVSTALWEDIDTPVSLSCYLLHKYEQYSELVSKRINPLDYCSRETFARDWQAVHLLSKSTAFPGFDPKSTALASYDAAEERCAKTNADLQAGCADHLLDGMRVWLRRILGPLTRRDLLSLGDRFRFGPGSTTSCTNAPTYSDKLKSTIDVSPRLLPFSMAILPQMWKDEKVELNAHRHSKGITVPKNSKTDRTIEIQPDLNVYYQLGVGSLLKEKLLQFGIDITDQGVNREMARRGSIDGSLATIDLSSASDTISLALVTRILPPRWLHLLELGRVGLAAFPDRVVQLQKWSAMGNGYTFELETAIFLSALLTVCDQRGYGWGDVSAYGDDLIFPSEFYDDVCTTLNLLGFKVNLNKSFGEGPFRESCGGDFYEGLNVRPAFLSADSKEDHFYEICHSYGNKIRAWANRLCNGLACDTVARRAWVRCYTACPEPFRARVPLGRDGGFVSNFDEAAPAVRPLKAGHAGYSFVEFFRKPVYRLGAESSFYVYLTVLAQQTHKKEFSPCETLPRKRGAPCSRIGTTMEWPDLGAWV